MGARGRGGGRHTRTKTHWGAWAHSKHKPTSQNRHSQLATHRPVRAVWVHVIWEAVYGTAKCPWHTTHARGGRHDTVCPTNMGGWLAGCSRLRIQLPVSTRRSTSPTHGPNNAAPSRTPTHSACINVMPHGHTGRSNGGPGATGCATRQTGINRRRSHSCVPVRRWGGGGWTHGPQPTLEEHPPTHLRSPWRWTTTANTTS